MKKEGNTIEEELKQQFWFLKDCYYIEGGNSHMLDALPPLTAFIKSKIRLAEESLVGRIRNKVQKAIDKLPSEMSMMQGGSYVTLDSMLDWEELSINKDKSHDK